MLRSSKKLYPVLYTKDQQGGYIVDITSICHKFCNFYIFTSFYFVPRNEYPVYHHDHRKLPRKASNILHGILHVSVTLVRLLGTAIWY